MTTLKFFLVTDAPAKTNATYASKSDKRKGKKQRAPKSFTYGKE